MANKVTPLAGTRFYPVEFIEVAEFHESNDGSGEPSQVHLTITIEGAPDTPIVMRMKAKRDVDELIIALMAHAKAVWPH